jgi:hypothetical protein
MKIGYVIVLDYISDEVHIYKFFLKNPEDIVNFIKVKGHDTTRCSWMVVDELKLKIH